MYPLAFRSITRIGHSTGRQHSSAFFTVIPIAIFLARFQVGAYPALMDDRYPATDDHQSVRLDYSHPDAVALNRRLPLVKWLLAVPHYIVSFFLDIAAFVLITGDYQPFRLAV
jgi:hypothetical protein